MSHVLVEIKSKPGIFFAIDREDAEKVEKMPSWFCSGSSGKYLMCDYKSGSVRKKVRLHRFIMGGIDMDDELVVDHINGNTLDNRKCNLRLITQSQNVAHRPNGSNKNSKSGIRGLHWCNTNKRWIAAIRKDEDVWWKKSFEDKKEAEKELAEKQKEYRELFGNYNFSDKEFCEPPEEIVKSLEELNKLPYTSHKQTKELRDKYDAKRREITRVKREKEREDIRDILNSTDLTPESRAQFEKRLSRIDADEKRAESRRIKRDQLC